MEPSDPASVSFGSKKSLISASKTEARSSDKNQPSSETPQKRHSQSRLPSRARSRGVALSVGEVREVAERLSVSSNRDRGAGSARRQIFSDEAPRKKPKRYAPDGSDKLPEKYEVLGKFFDCLDSSIRLLKMKSSMTTFTNLCPKIEGFTDRRFTHKHLSQLQFVLPEVIEIKKVLAFDERTSCMKPNLLISLNADAVNEDKKMSLNLRRLFRRRLSEFVNTHSKGDEVPEEPLPEPFCCLHSDRRTDDVLHPNTSLPGQMSITESSGLHLAGASHLSRSFRRHFSQKNPGIVLENNGLMLYEPSFHCASVPIKEPSLNEISQEEEEQEQEQASSPVAPQRDEFASKATHKKFSVESSASVSCPPSNLVTTPKKEMDLLKGEDNTPQKPLRMESTPAKLASTPARLMAATPALQPPKRCFVSPEDDYASSPDKLVRRPPLTWSLKFDTPVKNKFVEDVVRKTDAISSDEDDIFDILPEDLLHSIRDREKTTMEDKDPAISQAKRRRELIVALPQLFNMMHFLFKSTKRSVITKDELVYQIVRSRFDMIDRREVEEQLVLLKELVPEWISEKMASTGDAVVCVNKMLDPDAIRSNLAGAK